jgi:hypothetical protein
MITHNKHARKGFRILSEATRNERKGMKQEALRNTLRITLTTGKRRHIIIIIIITLSSKFITTISHLHDDYQLSPRQSKSLNANSILV